MSLKFAVADLSIQRVVEQESPYFQALDLLPRPDAGNAGASIEPG